MYSKKALSIFLFLLLVSSQVETARRQISRSPKRMARSTESSKWRQAAQLLGEIKKLLQRLFEEQGIPPNQRENPNSPPKNDPSKTTPSNINNKGRVGELGAEDASVSRERRDPSRPPQQESRIETVAKLTASKPKKPYPPRGEDSVLDILFRTEETD